MSKPDSNSNETLETETLGILAEKIALYATEADQKTLEAAKLVGEARKRVDAGEASDPNWYSWAAKNIKLSQSRLRELQRIAKAEDPRKELERQRQMTRERVERHRENKKSAALRNGGASLKETVEIEEDRKSLIAWAREAPLDHVTDVLSYARQVDSGDASSRSDEPAETAAA